MKKCSLFVVAFFSCFSLLVPVTFAQTDATQSASPVATPSADEFNFEKAFKDYVFVTDQYNTAHSAYILARGQYFQAKTLASQTKARDATVQMLVARDSVMKAYLVALRLRLSESSGISEVDKSGLFARIDTDVAWWESHKNRIDSAGNLNDLQADSDEASKHFPTTESLAYEVLSAIPLGKQFVLRTDMNTLLSRTKGQISKIRTNGDLDTSEAERWILDTEAKLTRSQDKELETQALITTLTSTSQQGQKVNKNQVYNQVLSKLNESLQYLRESSSYLKEVLKRIKYKQ